MPKFQHEIPEAGVLPPATDGTAQVPTKLHALRLRALLDLAKAFGVELPPPRNRVNHTKAEILPYMIAAEEAQVFRGKPESEYHLLHAQLTHDVRLPDRDMDDLKRRLKRAEHAEHPLSTKAKIDALKEDPDSLFGLQQRAKALGLKNTMGKGRDALREMIEAEDARLAALAETEAEGARD